MLTNTNLNRLGINLMRPWQVALREYIRAEYSHLLAGAAADDATRGWDRIERRGETERRQRDAKKAAQERRNLIDRRAIKLKV